MILAWYLFEGNGGIPMRTLETYDKAVLAFGCLMLPERKKCASRHSWLARMDSGFQHPLIYRCSSSLFPVCTHLTDFTANCSLQSKWIFYLVTFYSRPAMLLSNKGGNYHSIRKFTTIDQITVFIASNVNSSLPTHKR